MRRFSIFALTLLLTAPLFSSDWPAWRGGPARDGTWSEKLPAMLPGEGPEVIWKANLGTGYAGPAVSEGKLFIMDRILPSAVPAEQERVVCLDAKTGRQLWVHAYERKLQLQSGYENGPRATPTVWEGNVYTYGAMGDLYCLEAKSGKVIWKRDLLSELKAAIPNWGMASAPWIEEEMVIVQGGLPGGTVVAFDRSTGKEVWRSLTNKAGYAAVLGVGKGKSRQLIAWTADSIYGLAPRNGQPKWSVPRKLAWDQAVATPLYDSSRRLVLLSSDREGTVALRLSENGEGVETAWENKNYSALHGSAVLVDGHLYGMNHDGAIKKECGELRCLDLNSGKLLWAESTVTRVGNWAHGMVTYNQANKTFYITNDQGELLLAQASPSHYREIARTQLTGKTWSHPAYANGCIFARSETTLICARFRGGKPE